MSIRSRVGRRADTLGTVPTVVVQVMPKPELLDPQGAAVSHALDRLGYVGVVDVRQGKRFEVEVADASEAAVAAVRAAAAEVLSNPVIEDVVSVELL